MQFAVLTFTILASSLGVQAAGALAQEGHVTDNIGDESASIEGIQQTGVHNGFAARADAAAAYCPQLTCPKGGCCSYAYPRCCYGFCCPDSYHYCGRDGRCYNRP